MRQMQRHCCPAYEAKAEAPPGRHGGGCGSVAGWCTADTAAPVGRLARAECAACGKCNVSQAGESSLSAWLAAIAGRFHRALRLRRPFCGLWQKAPDSCTVVQAMAGISAVSGPFVASNKVFCSKTAGRKRAAVSGGEGLLPQPAQLHNIPAFVVKRCHSL